MNFSNIESCSIICSLVQNSVESQSAVFLNFFTYTTMSDKYGWYILAGLMGGMAADHYPTIYFDVTVSEAMAFLEENPQFRNKRYPVYSLFYWEGK